jgi:guanylate kinase
MEKVSVLVLTTPGGCGKTTLVKMLCQDKDIKGIKYIFFELKVHWNCCHRRVA